MCSVIKISAVLLVFSVAVHAAIPTKTSGSAGRSQIWGPEFPEGELAIYKRILEAYRDRDANRLERFNKLLLQHYPKSAFADNGLYLAGLLELNQGRIAKAVKNFGLVTDKYPDGNKRAAAMYGKSVAYSKLNLQKLSKKVLQEIVKEYPGSPESQKAWVELRLLQKGQG